MQRKESIETQIGICISKKFRRQFFWFNNREGAETFLSNLNKEKIKNAESEIVWFGHFDELVHSRCHFSRKIHSEFFQIRIDLNELEDGSVAESSMRDFVHFIEGMSLGTV